MDVTITGPRVVLPSVFDVTGFATDAVVDANVALAGLVAARNGTEPSAVTVDRRQACAAFLSEALFRPVGWERPGVWDALSGVYRTRDGWIRLHTNYSSHRAAAVAVLDVGEDRAAVERAVADRAATELESAVVAAGGCAAELRSAAAWATHPQGRATRATPAVSALQVGGGGSASRSGPFGDATRGRPGAALTGLRVLDLTRVLAGPVCTRFLAAYGADVLRIDLPGFAEVPALVPDVTAGKRCAALDLRTEQGRRRFERLVGQAHVLVHGLRPGVLAGLGFDEETLVSLNPSLVTAQIDAYGWDGPWRRRRGFDSLVQMSCGIADATSPDGDAPGALPCQALDHGTGYLTAAAVLRALTDQLHGHGTSIITASLIGAANLLMRRPAVGEPEGEPGWSEADLVAADTEWGPALRTPVPGYIAGLTRRFAVAAGSLGRHPAQFQPADQSM